MIPDVVSAGGTTPPWPPSGTPPRRAVDPPVERDPAPLDTTTRAPQDPRTAVSALRLEADRAAARRSRQDAVALAAAARQTRIRAQRMLQDNDERRARLHSRSTVSVMHPGSDGHARG
jgi:hypothetical protein